MFVALPLSLSLSLLCFFFLAHCSRVTFFAVCSSLPIPFPFSPRRGSVGVESAALESGGSAWSLTRLFAVCDFHDGFDSRYSEVG